MSHSPWTERFEGIDEYKYIARRTTLKPEPAKGLSALPVETASKLLDAKLKTCFVPTGNAISVIQAIVRSAMADSMIRFPTHKDHIAAVYKASHRQTAREEGDSPTDRSQVICLTGLSGVGKSAVEKAVLRLLPEPGKVLGKDGHIEFPLEACWYVQISEGATLTEILRPHALNELEKKSSGAGLGPIGKKKQPIADLRAAAKANAARSGVSLIMLDELQFVAESDTAVTAFRKVLQIMSAIGPQLVFGANFSLCHKLVNTKQENKARFAVDPIILRPDDPDSRDWKSVIAEYCRASGGLLPGSLVDHSAKLYSFTAGLKRPLRQLFSISAKVAVSKGKNHVDIGDCEEAFRSTSYAVNAEDVRIIFEQYLVGSRVRSDLWCPFDGLKQCTDEAREYALREAQRANANAKAIASLTEKERQAIESRHGRQQQMPKPPAKRLKRGTDEEMRENFSRLRDSFK